jgi:nitroreductase
VALSADLVRRIADCGTLAPSGDNLQPWIVSRTGDGLRIEVDPDRDRSLYNYQCRASLIAVGAMVENMAIAARQSGLSTGVGLSEPAAAALPIVTLTFEENGAQPDPLYDAIGRRCTNRKPYRTEPLPPPVLAALSSSAPADAGAILQFVEDRAKMRTVARAASVNDRLLFELRRLHDDLYGAVRWSEAEAEATRDGLYVKTLELGPMGPGFRLMRSWTAVRLLNLLGSSRFAPMHSYRTFLQSAAFGYLAMAESSARAYIEGGRRLQRIWLTATALGLSFQPMAGLLYLLAYRDAPGQIAPRHLTLLRRAEEMLTDVLPLGSGRAPIMLFRIGHAPSPSATSLRRSVLV